MSFHKKKQNLGHSVVDPWQIHESASTTTKINIATLKLVEENHFSWKKARWWSAVVLFFSPFPVEHYHEPSDWRVQKNQQRIKTRSSPFCRPSAILPRPACLIHKVMCWGNSAVRSRVIAWEWEILINSPRRRSPASPRSTCARMNLLSSPI